MYNLEDCKNDLRKFYFLPPFNTPSNFVAGDGYFLVSIHDNYPKEIRKKAIEELVEEFKLAGMNIDFINATNGDVYLY